TAVDPVCGMTVNPAKAAGHHEHQGKTYYFCALGCLEKFRTNPDRYLQPKPLVSIMPAGAVTVSAPASDRQVEYTCPMHPEVRQMGPGSCPKCGMALEPSEATVDESNPELDDMTRRFWISLALTLPLLLLMVSSMLPDDPLKHLLGSASLWLEFAVATPVVLWGGWPFFQRGWASIVNRHLNMFRCRFTIDR